MLKKTLLMISPLKRPSFNLFHLPKRFFPRKTVKSSYYKPTPQSEPAEAIQPAKIEKRMLGKEGDHASRQKVPEYIPDQIKFEQIMTTDYTAEAEMKEEAQRIKKEAKTKALVDIVREQEVKKVVTQDFDRFNEQFINLYKEDKVQQYIKQLKKDENPKQPKYDVAKFEETERLSKRLSRMGICSRRQAEKMIEQGMIKVDGKVIDHNMGVNSNNYIQVGGKSAMFTPTKQNTRIWLYHKPQKLMCTTFDPQNRPTIYHQLSLLGIDVPHIISVGRLDFLSEGLMILTNNGDLARALELPSSHIERSYRVRAFGRMFNEETLQKLRKGVYMGGRQYGPYHIDLIRRQQTNTWMHMKLFEGKNNEIRKVMRKFSLRVNRLIRTSYGPYTLGVIPNPNDLAEVRMTKDLKVLMHKYYREKTATVQSQISRSN